MTFVEQIYLYLEGKLGGAVDFVLKALLALIIYFIARKLIQKLCTIIKKNMLKFRADEAITSFTVSLVKYSLNILLVLTIIVQLNIVKESSITAAIASAGVAISLALQGGLSNFAGGVLILLLKPFKVGDYIDALTESGTVREIQIFHTVLTTTDNRVIYIPNGSLSSGIVVNYSKQDIRRVDWVFGVEYGSDFEHVKQVLESILAQDNRILQQPAAPFIGLKELADSSVNISVRVWVKSEDYWDVFFDMNKKVYATFNEVGIGFPYPQLTVHQAKD